MEEPKWEYELWQGLVCGGTLRKTAPHLLGRATAQATVNTFGTLVHPTRHALEFLQDIAFRTSYRKPLVRRCFILALDRFSVTEGALCFSLHFSTLRP